MRLYIISIFIIFGTFFTGCIQSNQTDSDTDGWTDVQEQKVGTNPYNKDTDGDGYWDSTDDNPLDKNIPKTKSSSIVSETRVAKWMAGVTCGTSNAHCFEIGGHIYVNGLPEKLRMGETYKVDIKFDYEWTDHEPGELSIQYMNVGFVTDLNLYSDAYGKTPEESGVVIDYLTESMGTKPNGVTINPNWIGFDSITLNKKINVSESLDVTAYITLLKKPQPSNAYLLFDLQGSLVLAGIPNSNYDPVRYQGIFPALAVKTEIE